MSDLTFLAVGIDDYETRQPLSYAVSDVERAGEVLGEDPEFIGANMDEVAVLQHLDKLRSVKGQSLFFYWAGHGESSGGLRLVTADDRGFSAHEVISRALEHQASQQLYVFDVVSREGQILKVSTGEHLP